MKKLYLIGNAHIDPVWLWRYQEGFSEILATFRSVLDRMKEFPEIKFTSACASYYEFVEKIDPEMFEEIKERVKEGRWCITGGWFLQPDCNIPAGESLARHSLISQRYFKEKFGKTARVGYNVDSFGHNASIPKILTASGMDSYVFMRPMPKEQGRNEHLFRWESDDGSAVTAYRIPFLYNCTTKEHILSVKDLAEERGEDMMAFYGIGNHGGGPSIALIDEINNLDIEKVHSDPEEFFRAVKASSLPTVTGELQHHARGCYSATSFVKTANRKAEETLLAAERLALLASKLTNYRYPKKKFKKAWKNILFNQFHDILGGCSVKSAYEDAAYLYGEAMSIAEQEIYFSMQKIAWEIDTQGDTVLPSYVKKNFKTWEHDTLGVPVTVFNPHAFPVRAVVTVNEVASKMTDADGREVPTQKVRGEQTNQLDKYRTAFIAEVAPLGYATYRLFTEKKSDLSLSSPFSVSETTLENENLYLELDNETGDIRRLYDKIRGVDLICGGCKAILLDESDCDTWAHDKTYLGETVGAFSGASFSMIENGPVRATIRATVGYGNSTLTRDFSLSAGDDTVTVKTRVDFHEKHRTLKFTFPTSDASVTASIPFGTVTRNGDTGEEPCGKFIKSGLLTVVNDGKYGYDTKNGEMRLTVLRGAIYADHFGERDAECEYMDMGVSEFTYFLFPSESNTESERRASLAQFPPRYLTGSFHKGTLAEAYSGIDTFDTSLIVSCVKMKEDGDHAVIRVFENDGNAACAKINLFGKPLSFDLPPHAIKTFEENGRELNFIEEPKG